MKKLKGHTTIELKNVVTGKVRRYEDDNMMTNAIGKMLGFATTHALSDNPLNIYTSHWANLLGGLVLFDSALTEDADAIYPPAGTKPVGYGQQGNTNSYTDFSMWGIYNTQESNTSATDTKIMVWDFSTSHGNGTIASVALTHRNTGLFGFGMTEYKNTGILNQGKIALGTIMTQSSKGKQSRNTTTYGRVGSALSLTDGSYVDFCIDSVNDEKYMFKVCADGLSVIKHKLYPEQIDVFKSANNFQSYEEETYAGTFSGSYFYHFYNPDEKVLYFWTLSSDVQRWQSTAVSVAIHKFDMTSKTLTANWKTFSSASVQHIYNNFVVTSSAIYVARYYDSKIRLSKFDTSAGTISDVWEYSGSYQNDGMIGRKAFIHNGLVYFPYVVAISNGAYAVIVDTYDDSIRYTNVVYYCPDGQAPGRQGVCIAPYDNTQMACGTMLDDSEAQQVVLNLQNNENNTSSIGNVYAHVNYLGTINNLSEPIVKTAQETMKVTYTITVESEE